MNLNLSDKISSKYQDYKIKKIDGGASNREFFRLSKNNESVICIDSNKEKEKFFSYLNINSYLSKINISIPKIYEKYENDYLLIIEDFGDLRFDKILLNYPIKDTLKIAVESLITIKNSMNFDKSYNLDVYKFKNFISEISEFPDYYYRYFHKRNISENLKKEFYECWTQNYNLINFNFSCFVHKDFNLNNLIYLPDRKDYLKCGILDFQDAFWGESCWDLFSLLEDSRIYFDDQFNELFIKYYYDHTNQNISLDQFREKYYFLNCSRQTRLLGRWIKLSYNLNQKWYLDFIDITKKRLFDSLKKLQNEKLSSLYNKLIPEFSNE